MPDREKVIKGLECCNYYGFHEDCPYDKKDPNDEQDTTCMMDLMADALALLKEQEAVEPIMIGKEGDVFSFFVCGDCGEPLYGRMNINYCAHCGRAVRWDA